MAMGIDRFKNLGCALAAVAGLALAGCATTGGVDGEAGVAASTDAPILQTSLGPVRGTTSEDGEVKIFRGVRYAASTEGMRFQEAADPQPWATPRDATQFGPRLPPTPERKRAGVRFVGERPSPERGLPVPQRLDARHQ